jgi:sugar phosphate isomerase/epimerase
MERRKFIKAASFLTTGVVLSGLSNELAGCTVKGPSGSLQQFGLQLYTLRDEMPKDPKGVLRQVASFGYKQIESYEHGDLGIFWGMTPKTFKQCMDDLGMKIIASHCDIYKDFQRKADQAKEAGLEYLICPYLGPQKSLDDYKRAADTFNKCGAIAKQAGLRFAYHNHDYSFKLVEGQFPQDVMMKGTSADLVDYEMDIYWVVTAGQDPIQWFNKYPNRFTLSHIKDRKKGAPPTDTDASVVVGTGSIDYTQILKVAKEKGLKYFLAEQERYDNTTPIAAVKDIAAYLKNIKI